LGKLPQDELIEWASCCDLLLVPYRNSLQVSYSQSARLAEYLALQRPIVATLVGDVKTWFPENYPGFCEPQDAQALKAAIVRQLAQKEQIPFPDQLNWTTLGRKSYSYLEQFCAR
jgi:glycosyltransferase involved in cell wall biosynthesis